jgi:hypothetical protein
VIEAHRRPAPGLLHDREAHGVRVADLLTLQFLELRPSALMGSVRRELDGHHLAPLAPAEGVGVRLDARQEQEESVDFGQDEVRRSSRARRAAAARNIASASAWC